MTALPALFLEPVGDFSGWDGLIGLFGRTALAPEERLAVLSGGVIGPSLAGAMVCACSGASLAAISEAISTGKAATLDDLGGLLKAGTNCGFCLPELRRTLRQTNLEAVDVA